MGVYCYKCERCGHRQERFQDMHAHHPERVKCPACGKGRSAHRDFPAEHGGAHSQLGRELWCDHNPHTSVGAEVNPDQIAGENARIKELGIKGVHFELAPDGLGGIPKATSRKGWKEYCEHTGYFNKDGGYGDAAPGKGHVERPQDPKAYTIDPVREDVIAHY